MGRSVKAVVLVVLVVVVAACLPPGPPNPPDPGRLVISAPADRSQAPASGAVPLRVDLGPGLDPAALRVHLTGAGLDRWLPPNRFAVIGRAVFATLTAADVVPGVVTIDVADRRASARSTISWEPAVDTKTADRCGVLDAARCLLPFPNDAYTVPDPNTDTGRRVNFSLASMPANTSGVHTDPTEWNRNDGFSPGSAIITLVPGLDLARSGIAPITDVGKSLAPDQPVVLLDAATGARQPFFAELDAQADPAEGAMLMIRPAKNLAEGHRFVVGLRNLRDAAGNVIPAERGFQLYRDRIPTFTPAIEARRAHMEDVIGTLARSGVARRELYAAWDFTVASERNLSERMLHIRDDAFATIGAGAPPFGVTSVQNDVNSQILRRITGVYAVPNYLTGTGAPGSRFNTGPDGLPARNGWTLAPFICNIPRAASATGGAPVTPARAGVYGHGLLGDNDEVNAGNVEAMSNEHDFAFCATKWAGFSDDDIGAAVAALQSWSNFPAVADRTQQGFLNTLVLARLLHTSSGFVSNPAFQATDGTPLIDTSNVFYDGNSQGGILGGAVTAVSTEWTRAVLGVPGMNYSTLLQRSVDFDTYKAIIDPAYPSELDRLLSLSIVQMLWDRAEADGYAAHMTTDPYPGTPAHTVLLHMAFGDHQVANVTTEIEARTIGASLRAPALAAGRSTEVQPFWAIPTISAYSFAGSALVVWDSGTPAPPDANVPPRPPQYGDDPHEDPRATPAARQQKSDFLRPNGAVVDVCGGQPCLTAAHP